MKQRFWFAIVLVLLTLLLGVYQSAPTVAHAEGDTEEITLGVVLPFTGSLGEYGTAFKEGIDLAVEQMNAQLEAAGSPKRFTVASADSKGTPDGAAKAFQTVVQTSGAQVVVGPLATSEVLGAKQFADENKIAIIAPASSGIPGAIPDDYIFRVMQPPDNFQSQAFSGLAVARGYENVVVLHLDDPFGNGLTDSFIKQFKEAGGKEVVAVKYAPEPSDLTSEVTKVSSEVARLSDAGKTAFMCICFLGDAQKVLQQAVVDPVMGTVDWMGAENLHTPDLLKDKDQATFLAQVHFTSVSAASLSNPNTQPFIDAYKAKYSKEPGPFTNYAYDAANIAMLSIIFAGNNGEAVHKIVPFIANHYIGTQVQTFLDANGDQAVAVLTVYQLKEDGSDFAEIGTYDGSTGKISLNEAAPAQE